MTGCLATRPREPEDLRKLVAQLTEDVAGRTRDLARLELLLSSLEKVDLDREAIRKAFTQDRLRSFALAENRDAVDELWLQSFDNFKLAPRWLRWLVPSRGITALRRRLEQSRQELVRIAGGLNASTEARAHQCRELQGQLEAIRQADVRRAVVLPELVATEKRMVTLRRAQKVSRERTLRHIAESQELSRERQRQERLATADLSRLSRIAQSARDSAE